MTDAVLPAAMIERAAIACSISDESSPWDDSASLADTRDDYRDLARAALEAAGVPALLARIEELEAPLRAIDNEMRAGEDGDVYGAVLAALRAWRAEERE